MRRGITSELAIALFALAAGGCSSGDARAAAQPKSQQDPVVASAVKSSNVTTDERVTRADAARIKGSADAKVWVVIVSDFQCPYCKTWHDQTAAALDDEYVKTGKVKLAYVNFPLGQHQNARPAAEAAMCAGAQGKFWEMHDKLFSTVAEWGTLQPAAPVYARLAKEIGLDVGAYEQCVKDRVMQPMIEADRERATKSGANSTPTFIIGSEVLAGAYPIEQFRPLIDKALAAAK